MSFASAALVPAPPELTFCAAQTANPTAAKNAVVARRALIDPPSLQEREKTLCHGVRRPHPESYNSSDECPTNSLTSNSMQFRILPGTELNVSEVCLGTMTWGEQNSEADAHQQLDYARAHGINFIDTAEMYPVPPNGETQGRTETFLGSWLKRRRGDGLVIATKVAGPGRRDWIRDGRTDLTREVIAEAVDTSLSRLQIDAIDLYQIHWPQRNVPVFGATEFDPSKERDGPPARGQAEDRQSTRLDS